MRGDLVSIDGRIVAWADNGADPDTLLACNFTYQKINTLSHRPLQAAWVADIAQVSWRALYGADAGVTPDGLECEVAALLRANRYPLAGNLIAMYLIPDGSGGVAQRMFSCERTLLYKGYAYVHTGLECVVTPYEYPLPQHKTALSLAAHTYAADYARRKGFTAAIAENNQGVLTAVGDNPLFAAVRDTVFTTPIEDGAADSVERRLGIEVCSEAGLTVAEQAVMAGNITDFDELFTVTPQGIVSVRTCEGKLFPHSLARTISAHLNVFENR